MLKGDLSATPLSDVLQGLAEQTATGCLHIDDDAGDEALVYFKNGQVYAAYVPGRRPQLGARLISSGALAPEALAEALEAQETELQGWRLGELLVHLGYVERPVVEAFVLEQLREAAFDLSRWPGGRYRFRKNEKTREDVGSHAAVPDLLAEVARRRVEWEVIAGVVHGPAAVPVLSAGGLANAELTLDQDQWALLCKVDGERTIGQLARDCGFTTFEAGQIVYALVGAGLLQVEETVEDDDAEAAVDEDLAPLGAALASAFASVSPETTEVSSNGAGDHSASAALLAEAFADDAAFGSELSRLLGGPAADPPVEPVEPVAEAPAEEPEPVAETVPDAVGGDLRDELASLTAALADLPSLSLPASLEPEYPVAPLDVAPVAEPAVAPAAQPEPAPAGAVDPFGDSLARVSEALSALLGDALPTVAMPEPPRAPEPTPEEVATAREEAERLERMRAAAAAELAQAHAMAEAARQQHLTAQDPVSAFEEAARAEAERYAAEAAPAEELSSDEARLEIDRLAAEETARVEADRLAAEEAARVAAERAENERLEAERLEAERLAAEEAARVEAEEAARAAAEEAERLAAEEAARIEAERLEAERAAAEEAARIEAERLEAERAAAEEAARIEAERLEAERAAAEEAARLAAEEAARIEAERLDAERAAAEEAARLAAEEAARIEAERLDAERAAAEEAARLAAEEAARAEAERLDAERAAAEEAARLAADRHEAELRARRYAEEEVAPDAPADADEWLAAEQAAHLETAHLAAEAVPAHEVASMLRDLSEMSPDTVETVEEYTPEPAAPEPLTRSPLSDTAALLRELTSLGLDDEPPPPAAAASAAVSRQPAPQKEQPKKRKGLFGRG